MLNRLLLMAAAARSTGSSGPSSPSGPEVGTYEFQFTASAAGADIAFFTDVTEDAHPSASFSVTINGEATTQNFNSLTFAAGDVVKITGTDIVGFPLFYAYKKDYLKSIDTKLPPMIDSSGNPVTDFGYMFAYCYSLASIPADLFDNNPTAFLFADVFYGNSIKEFHGGMFDSCPNITSFYRAFASTSAATIPGDLFGDKPSLSNLHYAFWNASVESVGDGLLDGLPSLKNVKCMFQGSQLKSIPSDFFSNNPEIDSFYLTFGGCWLKEIPEGLFSNNVKVTSFARTFLGNFYAFTSVPESLFASNTNVTTFEKTFDSSLPSGTRLKIGSSVVTNATDFYTGSNPITVVVPAGSTTETTFRAYAATVNNLTVETY